MKVKIYGVRGSIPTPGPETVRYGGNTTCLFIEAGGEQIILDAGSGIRVLGNDLLSKQPLNCSIFISHTHWDHIQGLPFFLPLFIPGNTIKIYGAFDPVYKKDLQTILTAQMEYCYFPVRSSELKASISYADLAEREEVQVGPVRITPLLMNHPVLTYGYRVECAGKRVFFTGDHEPPHNIYSPGDEGYNEFQGLIAARNKTLQDFIRGADLLIADAQYTGAEYGGKIGWGHGTFESCIELAHGAEVKHLLFTHHDPSRSDEELEKILAELKQSYARAETPRLGIATEGETIQL